MKSGNLFQKIKTGDGDDSKEEEEEDAEYDYDFATSLLFAANRYGLILLKLYVESEIIAKLLNVKTAAQWLSISDAQICPLLKEECMKMFWKNKAKFKSSSGWKQIKESSDLLEELLDFTDDGGGNCIAASDVGRISQCGWVRKK